MQKYIIIDNSKVVLFDISLNHSTVASGQNVTSAGFIDKESCFGLSDSLGVLSKKSDSKIIAMYLRGLGFKS